MVADLVLSRLIGSPLQAPLEWLRHLAHKVQCWREPGLADVLAEGQRTRDLMRSLISANTNCIDIGAHLGLMTCDMVRLAPHGRHIAFEPVPHKARWLQRKLPQVNVQQAAVGAVSTTTAFALSEDDSANSALRPNENTQASQMIQVRCLSLDDLVAPDHPIGFIKMDAIGGEFDILRGAHRLIMRDRPVLLFECTPNGTRAFGVDPAELFRHLTGTLGYWVYSLSGWARKEPPLDERRFLAAQVYPFEAFNFVGLPMAAGLARDSVSLPGRTPATAESARLDLAA